MTGKSDFFFFYIKQLYPDFMKPSSLDVEIWDEVLAPYTKNEILNAVKDYRKTEVANYAPNPAKFRPYLVKNKPAGRGVCLPLCPEDYLMRRDIKAGCCRHLFPVYVKAVDYLLNIALKAYFSPEQFKKISRGERYRLAVEKGLFDDFDKTLDLMKNREEL